MIKKLRRLCATARMSLLEKSWFGMAELVGEYLLRAAGLAALLMIWRSLFLQGVDTEGLTLNQLYVYTILSAVFAPLLDVRTPEEYQQGHIPGSKNIPLQTIDRANSVIENKQTPIFTYCYAGSRSRQAASQLVKMGYANVKNIGGIAAYTGKTER